MLTLWVWVVFSCLSEEDVSALRHGTVFIVIKTGFMTNNDRRLRGYVKTLFPLERSSSRNACVFLHVTVRCSHYRCLYTRIYYVRKEIAKTPIPTHTIDTPESFKPHTNFGMAVGSMQTWNLSWLFANIIYFIVCYWSLLDNLHLHSHFLFFLFFLRRTSGTELPIPATKKKKSCHGTSKAFSNLFNTEALKILSRFSVCPATIMWQVLYYCQRKKKKKEIKKKANYEH